MRSRANSLPRWRCRATARSPPPSCTCWSRSRRRRTCSRLCARLLLKATLAGLIWDCKTSILRTSLLLLRHLQARKRLGLAAADLLTVLPAYLPTLGRHLLCLGKLTAGTGQGLDFEVKGGGNIDIHIGL